MTVRQKFNTAAILTGGYGRQMTANYNSKRFLVVKNEIDRSGRINPRRYFVTLNELISMFGFYEIVKLEENHTGNAHFIVTIKEPGSEENIPEQGDFIR